MTELFLKLVNMSISAGWLVLAVAVLRLFLHKAPKWLWPVLWGGVGLRLVLPASIKSALSLIPSAETFSPDIVYQTTPVIHSGVAVIDRAVNPIVGQTFAPTSPAQSVNPLQFWAPVLALSWAVGVCVLLAGAVVSYVHLRRRVATAVRLRANIYQSERTDAPFVLGLFRPRIYLPFSLPEEQAGLVIAHEQAHIARRDHWIKLIGFLLLCVYWFHPLLWAAYALLCRDIELACDERVIKHLTAGQRADYSQALLSCSVPRRSVAVSLLAFGEVGVKERVKHVLNYKKPAFWLGVAAVVCCIIVAICFLTDPPAPPPEDAVLLGREPASNAEPEPSRGPAPVNSPEPAPPANQETVLTPENARQTIQAILGSFRVAEDRTVTFSIPEALPASEDGNTSLTITLNITYSSELGTYSVNSLLDRETDWTAGQVYVAGFTAPDRGEAKRLMLRAAYLTGLGDGSHQEYAANYVELSIPFFDTPVFSVPSVELAQNGRDLRAYYLLRDGSQFSLSLTLPNEFQAEVGNEILGCPAPQVILTDGAGNQAGALTLYPLSLDESGSVKVPDAAENVLPMSIFAMVALSNHAGYEDYTVIRHSATGASATARYIWQDLTDYGGRSPEAPWLGEDCVLIYDWPAMPCFAELMLGDGAIAPDQLAAIAESVTIR